jgi:hypothetical protein
VCDIEATVHEESDHDLARVTDTVYATAGKDITGLAPGYYLGAALMLAGGVIAMFLGVHAQGQSLESIATPLTAEEDDTPSCGPRQSAAAPA